MMVMIVVMLLVRLLTMTVMLVLLKHNTWRGLHDGQIDAYDNGKGGPS